VSGKINNRSARITQVFSKNFAYNLRMMNLTDRAKNHFLNFFSNIFSDKQENGVIQFCKAEYGKEWEHAYICWLEDGQFPNYIRKTL